jgi:hypothetical protein
MLPPSRLGKFLLPPVHRRLTGGLRPRPEELEGVNEGLHILLRKHSYLSLLLFFSSRYQLLYILALPRLKSNMVLCLCRGNREIACEPGLIVCSNINMRIYAFFVTKLSTVRHWALLLLVGPHTKIQPP